MVYVPPKYPGAIPTIVDLPNRADDIDWMYAARYNELKKELRACLIELGVDPAGAHATVVARLNALGVVDKISEGDTSVETIDTDADGHVDIKTENVLCGKFNSDGILDLPKQSGARVYLSGAQQVIGSGVPTKIELDGETYDNQNEFDPVTNHRFTVKKAGDYSIAAGLQLLGALDGQRIFIYIYKNGGSTSGGLMTAGSANNQGAVCSDILYLAVNDFIEMWITQIAGVNKNVHNSSVSTWLAIHKLS